MSSSHEDKEQQAVRDFIKGLSEPALKTMPRKYDYPPPPPEQPFVPRRVPKEELDAAWADGSKRAAEQRRQSSGMVQKLPADVQTMELRMQLKALVDRVTALEAEVQALKEGK
jgi:hypothetical protein